MTFPRTERIVYVTETAAGYALRCQSRDELRSDNIDGRSAYEIELTDEEICIKIVCLKIVPNKKN